MLATRHRGSRVAGLTAALFLAVAPLHVLDSHYVKHDVPVTLLIVLAYLAYCAALESPSPEIVAEAVSLGRR